MRTQMRLVRTKDSRPTDGYVEKLRKADKQTLRRTKLYNKSSFHFVLPTNASNSFSVAGTSCSGILTRSTWHP